jgi:alpha-mannosidase
MTGGALVETAVVRAGHNFNTPLRVGHVASTATANSVKEIMSCIQFSGSPNLVLETIKRGEDDDDVTATPIKKRDSRNVILRIYEAYGGKGTAKISTYELSVIILMTDLFRLKGLSRPTSWKTREMKLMFLCRKMKAKRLLILRLRSGHLRLLL